MKKTFLLLILSAVLNTTVFSQNNLCEGSIPICLDTVFTFMATNNSGVAQPGADYTCLGTQPNPHWFFFEVQNAGAIDIYMYTNPHVDIDFTLWGPFTSPTSPCVAQLTAANTVDCSYSTSWNETANIPNAQSGQYYILLVTNYSNQPNIISLVQSNAGQTGTGTMNCLLINPILFNGPLCEGEPIVLWANTFYTAYTYYWTGPNGFVSTQQFAQIDSANQSHAGTYFLNLIDGIDTIYTYSIEIEIHPHPEIYLGEDIEVCNNVSIILNAGCSFNSYLWNINVTSQQVFVSSTTMGIGTHTYWVTAIDYNGCVAEDTILVTFVDCTGLKETDFVEIMVYPNPADISLHIILPDVFTGSSQVYLYDVYGRKVFEEQFYHSKFSFDVEPFHKGIYFLKVINNDVVLKKVLFVK